MKWMIGRKGQQLWKCSILIRDFVVVFLGATDDEPKSVRDSIPDLGQDEQHQLQRGAGLRGGGGVPGNLAVQQPGAKHRGGLGQDAPQRPWQLQHLLRPNHRDPLRHRLCSHLCRNPLHRLLMLLLPILIYLKQRNPGNTYIQEQDSWVMMSLCFSQNEQDSRDHGKSSHLPSQQHHMYLCQHNQTRRGQLEIVWEEQMPKIKSHCQAKVQVQISQKSHFQVQGTWVESSYSKPQIKRSFQNLQRLEVEEINTDVIFVPFFLSFEQWSIICAWPGRLLV